MAKKMATKRLEIADSAKHGGEERFVLDDEDGAAYSRLLDQLCRWIDPQGPIEERLCREMAACFWRKDRGHRLEKEMIDGFRKPRRETGELPPAIQAVTRDGHGARVFGTLIRYHSQVATEVHRTMHMLTALRQLREGSDIPLDVL